MPKLRRISLAHRSRTTSALDKIPNGRGIPHGLAGARRNAGRGVGGDGTKWNSSYFIGAAQVDGYPDSEESETEVEGDMAFILQMIDALEAREAREKIESRSSNVSLLEMVRPARARGVKRFEMVKKPHTATGDDSTDEDFEMVTVEMTEEDWESVYAEDMEPAQPKTYSEVLRGNNEA
ncbi:hypothetical protein FIBSPDRAFT_861859 [Athelia psychrophila]|uniref:Uncharacterized protein n=1 Tax=Athelia psychrophila TaxID=1759441 RepID=A0A166IZ60_9AGAM|nr:hypothetical protein FIBSPDRAFT_861859 [Fibularhizoctonia sp. CBS 109695]